MRRTLLLPTLLLVLVACAQRNENTATTETAATDTAATSSSSTSTVPSPPVVIMTGSSPEYAVYLADGTGHSLYIFMKDKPGQGSNCYGECANDWPPLLASSQPSAGNATVDGSKLGVVDRTDGTRQVTYSGWPLYRYSEDESAGDTRGEGVTEFGGEWYLISAAGTKIEKRESKGAPS